MNKEVSILIIGGGLAGLTSAIHLAQEGFEIVLIEKNTFPKHKVCGEYVSNEVLPYLETLGIFPFEKGAKKIDRFQFSGLSDVVLNVALPLGGFGISRYTLDKLMVDRALLLGVTILQATVNNVSFIKDHFEITTAKGDSFVSTYVLGAYGKRSGMDIKLSRKFIQQKSPWLGVKAHYKAPFPNNLVALHNFSGGYCGLSKVETDYVNVCYLADYKSFKKYKNVENYQTEVLCRNNALRSFFKESEIVFEKPLTISQISFEKKAPIENHIFMIGDSAGLIHPLCGNGMAMAIHSAKIISILLIEQRSEKRPRLELEDRYKKQWNAAFQKRLKAGWWIQNALQYKSLTRAGVAIISKSPYLLQRIIQSTHGSAI